jgi:hypothetical protein
MDISVDEKVHYLSEAGMVVDFAKIVDELGL